MVNNNSKNKIIPILLTVLLMFAVFASSVFVAIQSGKIKQKTSLPQPTLTPVPTLGGEAGDSEKDLSVRCDELGGTWLAAANECESINQQVCEKLGGKYDSCASACRHKPKTEVCIQICIEVCSFGESNPSEPTL